MNEYTSIEKETIDYSPIDIEAEEVEENVVESENNVIFEDSNATAGQEAANQTAVSPSADDQLSPSSDISPKSPRKNKMEPDRVISSNFDVELKILDSMINKIDGGMKNLKSLPKRYDIMLRTIFERFLFVNKHNKKDVCIFALKYGQLLNTIESHFEKKHKFTELRSNVFNNVSERYVQKWQQAARLGEMAFHFSEFGLDAVLELSYMVKSRDEEFKNVPDNEVINIIEGFINLGGWSSEINLFRNGMDAAVTHFRLTNVLNEKNITGMAELFIEAKPLILQMVKTSGGALEKNDAQQIVDKIKDLPSEEERRRFLDKYTMDKCVVGSNAQGIKTEEEKKKISKGTNEVLVRFNSRFESKNINELALGEEQAIKALKNLLKYFRVKNIDVNAITKEA